MATISKSTLEVYKIRNAKFEGWADISIDAGQNNGRIQIASSHGNWSYYWGACGESFKSFLVDLEISYTANKFGAGNFFDLKATLHSWKELVLQQRRAEEIEPELARNLWSEIVEIEEEGPDLELCKLMLHNSTYLLSFFDFMPDLITKINPSFVFFWENLWSEFVKGLNKEIFFEV